MKLRWKLPLIGLATGVLVTLDSVSPRLWTPSFDDKLAMMAAVVVWMIWIVSRQLTRQLNQIEGKLDAI